MLPHLKRDRHEQWYHNMSIAITSHITAYSSKILLGSLKSSFYQRTKVRFNLSICDYILKSIALPFYRLINNIFLNEAEDPSQTVN